MSVGQTKPLNSWVCLTIWVLHTPGAEFAFYIVRKVKTFADQFKEKHDKLDVLVNNAGEYVPPDDTTEDGFEVCWECGATS